MTKAEQRTDEGHLSKTAMIKEALKAGHEKNSEIEDYVRRKYGIVLGNYINVIKSTLKKKAAGRNGTSAGPKNKVPGKRTGNDFREILAVKEMVDRIGLARVRRILELLEEVQLRREI